MQRVPTPTLRRRRRSLLRQMPDMQQVLRGSLIERYKRCGKPGCRCARGRGHGPKYYLSVGQSGQRPQMDYVPQDRHDQVEQLLANYRTIRDTLDRIAAINRELLRRRQPL